MPAHFLVFIKKIHVCLHFKISNMFYLLRKAHLLQLFVGLSVLLFCGVEIFIKPLDTSLFCGSLPCATLLAQWLVGHPVGAHFLVFILFLLQVGLLFHYVRKSDFLDEENILSILFFCAISLGMGIFLPLSPAWFTITAALAVLNLSNYANNTSHSKTFLLLAGIVLGVATLFDLTALLLILFFILHILINQIDKLRDLMAMICGILLPYCYLFAYHYLAGSLLEYLHSFTLIRLHFPLFTQPHFTVFTFIALGMGLLLTIYVLVRIKVLYNNKLIVVRRRFLFLCVFFGFNILMLLTTNVVYPYSLHYVLIPVTVAIIAFIPVKNFAISTEILLMFLTASFVVMARF